MAQPPIAAISVSKALESESLEVAYDAYCGAMNDVMNEEECKNESPIKGDEYLPMAF